MHTAHTTDIAPDFAPDWAAIAVVILGVTAFAVGQGLTYPLIALILESRGVSSSMAGLNASVFALGLELGTDHRVVRVDRRQHARLPVPDGKGEHADGATERMNTTLVTARFFMERSLPETAAHLARITSGADSTMAWTRCRR